MKKFILLSVLFIAVSMNAQFKFGAIGGVGVGSNSTTMPIDSFTTVYGGGPLVEYALTGFSLRTGAVYQSNNQLLVPLQGLIKTNTKGGFIGLGVSFNAFMDRVLDGTPGTYDLIFGNKVARNIDFSIGFSYPMKGNIHDAVLQIRMCIFPISTCSTTCGF